MDHPSEKIATTGITYVHGRILEEFWQDHGPDKVFGCSANFPHFDRNFLYILCLARACPGFF
ncbi:hypothetical protein Hanom_Chr01g00022681 [Helianthus anomalus]